MKKNNIFRFGFAFGFAILLIILTISVKKNNVAEKKIMVESIADYVIKIPTYKKIDDDYAMEYIAERYDGWNKDIAYDFEIDGGCTSSAKVMKNGDMIVSRNMDLTLSNSPEYVFYINEEGRYKTFNIAYVDGLGGTYQDVLKNGLDEKTYKIIPYLVTDAINEYGLSIEMNLRNAEYNMQGELILGSNSTALNAKVRVSSLALVRYLADHAKDVNEALKIIGAVNYQTKESYGEAQIDIYSMNSTVNSNYFAYQIADASGNYGIIEIADNKVYFHPKASYHANYFITDEFHDQELFGSGKYRIDAIKEDFENIDNIYEMMANMSKVRYSKTYALDNTDFVAKGEYAGLNVYNAINIIKKYAEEYNFEVPDYSHLKQTMINLDTGEYVIVDYNTYKNYEHLTSAWTEKFIDNPEHTEVDDFTKWFATVYSSLDETQKRNMSLFWNTIHHVTYNNTQKYAIVTFYEDDSTTRVFDFKNID